VRTNSRIHQNPRVGVARQAFAFQNAASRFQNASGADSQFVYGNVTARGVYVHVMCISCFRGERTAQRADAHSSSHELAEIYGTAGGVHRGVRGDDVPDHRAACAFHAHRRAFNRP
jgi:hypothetical protein